MAFTIRMMVTLKTAYIILSHIVPVGPFLRALMVKILKYEKKRRDQIKILMIQVKISACYSIALD